jgi:RimJ/RimL family protein N-acetyltransferase
MLLPLRIRTPRLVLTPWRAQDAIRLGPVLAHSAAELARWTPPHATGAAPLGVLGERLAAFASQFVLDEAWRYGLFEADTLEILGEASVFPRNATARVPLAAADRVEFGYWVRSDRTGQGIATEAMRAALDAAAATGRFSRAEIRCDARNGASASIAARLGFSLATTTPPQDAAGRAVDLQVWTLSMASIP